MAYKVQKISAGHYLMHKGDGSGKTVAIDHHHGFGGWIASASWAELQTAPTSFKDAKMNASVLLDHANLRKE